MPNEVKNLRVDLIDSQTANRFIRLFHYSGSHAFNARFNFGVFWNGRLEGVAQFGPPLDKRKTIGLVSGTGWDGFLELNRLAFTDVLPKNSESRALSVMFRMLRKNQPRIEWVLSFADGCQCGDGHIYRALGFVLTDIKKNSSIYSINGEIVHKMSLARNNNTEYYKATNGRASMKVYLEKTGGSLIHGHHFRYILFFESKSKNKVDS